MGRGVFRSSSINSMTKLMRKPKAKLSVARAMARAEASVPARRFMT